jgi:hypothetical protein
MRERRGQRGGVTAAFCAAFALLILAATPESGQAQQATKSDKSSETSTTLRGVWYSGFDAVKGAHYVFSGGTVALNGDLSRDGFFVRAYGSRVDYDLDPGNGRGYQADLMLGYRVGYDKIYGGLHIGVDYQNYRLDPDDPSSEVRGTEWGFKVAADLATLREGTPLYYALAGNYSTSFSTYWARARVGTNLHGVTFGPEAIVLGDVGFDAQRVGGFIIFDLKLSPQISPLEIGLHAGHQFVAGENGGTVGGVGGGEGTYGGIVFTLVF